MRWNYLSKCDHCAGIYCICLELQHINVALWQFWTVQEQCRDPSCLTVPQSAVILCYCALLVLPHHHHLAVWGCHLHSQALCHRECVGNNKSHFTELTMYSTSAQHTKYNNRLLSNSKVTQFCDTGQRSNALKQWYKAWRLKTKD